MGIGCKDVGGTRQFQHLPDRSVGELRCSEDAVTGETKQRCYGFELLRRQRRDVVFGAPNARTALLTSMSTIPAAHPCLTLPSVRGLPPAQIHDSHNCRASGAQRIASRAWV